MIRNDACRTAYSKGAYTSAELRFLKPVAFTTDLDWYMFCACVRPDFRDQEQSARDIAHYQKMLKVNRVTCRDLYVACKTMQSMEGYASPHTACQHGAWELARVQRDEREDECTNRAGMRDMLHARRLLEYVERHLRDREFADILEEAPTRPPIKYHEVQVRLHRHEKMLRLLYDAYDHGYDCAGAMQLIDTFVAANTEFSTWLLTLLDDGQPQENAREEPAAKRRRIDEF